MIYIITHKNFESDFVDKKIYSILHVGKNQNSDSSYDRDDTGDNISDKNPNYCELTGLYWIWKNSAENADDITGIVHYRRFFTSCYYDFIYTYFNKKPKVLTQDNITKCLNSFDIILPKRILIKRTIREFYNDVHVPEDMDITRCVIKEIYPDYLLNFDNVMKSHRFYYGNMMICKKKLLDEYSEWLFKILFKIEEKIDINKYYDPYQSRVFGFISERLLQVWVLHNNLRIKEFPVYNTESRQPTLFTKIKKLLKFNKK